MTDKEVFDLYTEYLICCMGQATSTAMSRMLENGISHDRISRMLGKQEWTTKHYWQFIKPLVRQTETYGGILKIDDTIEEKPHSSENELICWHYDHSKDCYVKGINLLNFVYEPAPTTLGGFNYPVAFETIRKTQLEVDSKTGKIKRKSAVNKNELVRRRLRILTMLNKVKYNTILWDSWFSCKETMEMVHYELKKTFIGAIQNNRLVAVSLEDKRSGKFTRINELMMHTTNLRMVYLKGLDFPVQIVRQVFTNKDGSVGELYLVTNDLELSSTIITFTYGKRWVIEVYHRSWKQNVALEKSPTKKVVSQNNHIFASMIAWVKLEIISKSQQQNQYAFKIKLYTKAIQTAFFELQEVKKQVALKLRPTLELKPLSD